MKKRIKREYLPFNIYSSAFNTPEELQIKTIEQIFNVNGINNTIQAYIL